MNDGTAGDAMVCVRVGSRRQKIYGRGSGWFRVYFSGVLKLSALYSHELDLAGQMRE
jgi:hypothetical protein